MKKLSVYVCLSSFVFMNLLSDFYTWGAVTQKQGDKIKKNGETSFEKSKK